MMMKCRVLNGPIDAGFRLYRDGDEILLDPPTAQLLALIDVVEILGEAPEESPQEELPQEELPQEESPPPPPVDPVIVNINTASNEQLQALKYVGPSTAAKIEAGRPYESLEDAQITSGLKAEQWSAIETQLTI